MSEQKKSPSTPEEAPKDKSVNEILIDLADHYFECWKPALTIESSKFLGKRLAIAQAEITLLVKERETLRAENTNLHDRLQHVEQMCADLCKAKNQSYHALIKIKEGHNKFIDETNAKLKKAGF